MSKPEIKNLYKEGIIFGLAFVAFVLIILSLFFLLSYKGKCVIIDGNKEYYVYREDLKKRTQELDNRMIQMKDSVTGNVGMGISLSALSAGCLSQYEINKINKGFSNSFIQEMNLFYQGRGSEPILELDSSRIYFDPQKVEAYFLKDLSEYYFPSKDAQIRHLDNGLVIEKGQFGYQFDAYDLNQKVQEALSKGSFDRLIIKAEKFNPKVKVRHLNKYKKIIAEKSIELDEKDLSNLGLLEGIIMEINNYMIPKGKSVDVNEKLLEYLTSICSERDATAENMEQAYSLSYKVKEPLIEALKASKYMVKGKSQDDRIVVKNTGTSDSLISAYLMDNKVVMLVLSK